jgi:hypothetical protein
MITTVTLVMLLILSVAMLAWRGEALAFDLPFG